MIRSSKLAWLLMWSTMVLVPPHFACAQPAGETVRAKVIAYASGTTFSVLDPTEKLRRVKLTGVDAPERRQRFAPQAKQLAAEWLSAKPIDIVVDAIDKDNRLHGRVSVDGRDVGLTLIEAGLAWCDPTDESHLSDALRNSYRQACDKAKSARRGLWQDASPYPPWEYRKIPEFDPPPATHPGTEKPAPKSCQQIGYETLQCDDGTNFRAQGSEVVGSDGTRYSRRGNTVTGTDGNRFERQGSSVYGTDGTVCRSRGRRIDCY